MQYEPQEAAQCKGSAYPHIQAEHNHLPSTHFGLVLGGIVMQVKAGTQYMLKIHLYAIDNERIPLRG